MQAHYLLQDVIVDTVGTAATSTGGPMVLQVSATSYGSGSVTIQGRFDALEWTTLTYGGNPAVFTSNQLLKLDYAPNGMSLRATLSGSTGATAVNVVLFG